MFRLAETRQPLLVNYSNGDLSASASFDVNNNTLLVTLTNTSLVDPSSPSSILTAVFFDIAGDPTLTPLSAQICATCTVTYGGTTDANKSVAGEWAYAFASSDLAYGTDYGISSSGLGIFGPPDLFPNGTNLASPIHRTAFSTASRRKTIRPQTTTADCRAVP